MAGSGTAHLRDDDDIVLRVEHLVVEFPMGDRRVQAVSDVSFDVRRGETLGLVGESGCGKTTTGRSIMMLPPPTSGVVEFGGKDMARLSSGDLRATRPKLQMIFQDPISSLNPRRTIDKIVGEGLSIWKRHDAQRVADVLETVGLDPAIVSSRRPHQFSGGQCQRISIARVLAMEPEVVICDEPVSALDVSVQAQILNLLEDMKERFRLTLVFIAHDLAVVKNVSDRIAVMYMGKLCEIGPSQRVYAEPSHHYTVALLEAVPLPDPRAKIPPMSVVGEMPSPLNPPSGCRFRTRCPAATSQCVEEEPQMREVDAGHFVACHHPVDRNDMSKVGLSAIEQVAEVVG
jgi:peptide/nickel transport system ATP-binding protein